MKPLNRPMFRYGGPIKEGIMSGIREPKKNGGSMNEPQAINTVGSPLAPQGSDGRQQYAFPLLAPIAMAAGRALARPFGKFVAKRIPQIFAGPNKQYGTGKKIFEAGFKKKAPTVVFEPNKLGLAFKNDPLAKSVMTGSSFVGRGIKAGGKGIYNVGKYATTTPSGLTFLGAPVAYQAGKYFLSSGEEIKDPNDIKKIKQGKVGTSGAPGGGDPGMYLEPQTKKGGGVELTAEQLRKKNVERYRDIMDIKGMNKDAAYNSLIAASQAINESGDFKGDIKSGKLINQIIQATSKQFDKPKATKDAINTLIAKAEIEKDMNKEKNALENKKTNLQIKAAEKALAGDSFDEAILKKITATNGKMPTGSDLAGILKATKGIDSVVLDGSQVTPGGEVTFLQESVNEKIKEGTSVNPGAYVLNSKILIVDEQGNVSQYY